MMNEQRGIPMFLPDNWTPEQALAVVELLDALSEHIAGLYEIAPSEQRHISRLLPGDDLHAENGEVF